MRSPLLNRVLIAFSALLFTLSGTLTWAQSASVNKDFWNDILNDRGSAIMRQLAMGADPNSKSEEGQPAVMWAIQNNSWAVYDLFTGHQQFDPNITNENNETPLMYLAILGETQRGQDLVQKGAKINRLGWTPLHYAASRGQLEFAQWLLNEGAFIHAPAPDGTTPLMMAAFSGDQKMVDLLLAAGADLRAVNINQHTAIDWAESSKHNSLANYLRRLSALPKEQWAAGEAALQPAPSSPAPSSSGEASSKSGSSRYFDLDRFD